jgi:hypothetical protein
MSIPGDPWRFERGQLVYSARPLDAGAGKIDLHSIIGWVTDLVPPSR